MYSLKSFSLLPLFEEETKVSLVQTIVGLRLIGKKM